MGVTDNLSLLAGFLYMSEYDNRHRGCVEGITELVNHVCAREYKDVLLKNKDFMYVCIAGGDKERNERGKGRRRNE